MFLPSFTVKDKQTEEGIWLVTNTHGRKGVSRTGPKVMATDPGSLGAAAEY